MSFMSSDGRKSGSRFVAKRRDAEASKGKDALHSANEEAPHMGPKSTDMSAGNPKKGAVPNEKPRTNAMGEAKFSAANANVPGNDVKAEPEGVDAGQVAAEHGNANQVTIHSNHEGGQHTVVSKHPSGHMHTSQHKSAQEAHEAAKQLSGVGHDENTDKAPNEDSGQGSLFGGGESDGFSMPSL